MFAIIEILMANKQAPPNDNRGKKYNRIKTNDRALRFREYYTDPNSPTFQNILQSALRAGFAREYAENLSNRNPKWFQELNDDVAIMRARMLAKAEKNIDSVLTYNDAQGENRDIASLKLKASTFVAERVGKDVYSARQEVTGKDGRRLFTNEINEKHAVELEDLFVGVQKGE